MNITYRPATTRDCVELVDNMRPHDRAECQAALGAVRFDYLDAAVQFADQATAALDADGRLICVFGVTPSGDPMVGVPWLLGTTLLDRYMISVCKHAREIVASWHRRYPVLTNCTDKRNRRILLWLRWLGFQFVREVPMGPGAIPFIQFESRHV